MYQKQAALDFISGLDKDQYFTVEIIGAINKTDGGPTYEHISFIYERTRDINGKVDCWLPEHQVRSIFDLAGLKIKQAEEIQNQYWPDAREYNEIRKNSPWWLVILEDNSIIKLGWLKRVLEIDWSNTSVKSIVTDDNVTKSETMVHAYSYGDAVKYLEKWKYANESHLQSGIKNDQP